MKVTANQITVQQITVQMGEHEAKVIALIMGRIGGGHKFREVTGSLYNQLIMAVGQNEYDKFANKHRDDIEQGMFLKSDPINF